MCVCGKSASADARSGRRPETPLAASRQTRPELRSGLMGALQKRGRCAREFSGGSAPLDPARACSALLHDAALCLPKERTTRSFKADNSRPEPAWSVGVSCARSVACVNARLWAVNCCIVQQPSVTCGDTSPLTGRSRWTRSECNYLLNDKSASQPFL